MLPNLESLVELGRRDGVDIRPTLLRVLTDIYVQRPKHASDEERQYTELALRLIDAVDTSTKVAVANTLASYGEAPLPVVRRLARDCIEVAEPIIRYSQCLPPAELRQIAEEFGPDYARAIIAAHEIKRPSAPNGRSPAATHTSTSALALRESRTTMHRATEVQGSASKIGAAAELCELFFSASASERRLILLNLPYVAPDALTGAASLEGPEACRRLEDAALQRKRGEFARELAQALRLSMAQGQRITEDNSGEPMVVAAKALGMPTEVLQRILLFLNPAIGHSVRRIYDLSQLFVELAPGVAMHLVAIWREAAPGAARRAVHQPLLWNDEAARSVRAPSATTTTRAAQPVSTRSRFGKSDI